VALQNSVAPGRSCSNSTALTEKVYYVICCQNTTAHIATAVASPDYIQGIVQDTLGERNFLVVKRRFDEPESKEVSLSYTYCAAFLSPDEGGEHEY